MVGWIIPPVAGLIETSVTPEINADGIAAVECHDGIWRFYLYADQMAFERDGAPHKIMCGKIIVSPRVIPTVIGQLAMCMIHQSARDIVPFGKPRLVT